MYSRGMKSRHKIKKLHYCRSAMRKHAAEQECIPIKGTLSSAQPCLKFRGSLGYNSGSTNETNQGQAVLQN